MRINVEEWRSRKRLFWEKMWTDLGIGYLDRDLLPLLILVNKDSELYTTSSCSGRITVMDSSYPWSREETGIVFKSHIPVEAKELEFIYNLKPLKNVWINVTGPIIHLYALNLNKALTILKASRKLGFKHSGILNVNKKRGILLELVTGIYISQLARCGDQIIIDKHDLDTLVGMANRSLIEGKLRLHNLYVELSKILPTEVDQFIEEDLARRGIRLSKAPLDIFNDMCREIGTRC